jgi:hypothetical protein
MLQCSGRTAVYDEPDPFQPSKGRAVLGLRNVKQEVPTDLLAFSSNSFLRMAR